MTTTHLPTVVYVEDNDGDAVLLKEALLECGHEVELMVIERGDQALHYFQVKETARDLPPPHCVLLDSHLPMVTGAELVKFLRGSAVFNQTPIYLFASKQDYDSLTATAEVSSDSFIRKPGNWSGFLALARLLMKSAEATAGQHEAGGAEQQSKAHPEVTAPTEIRLKA
ncbi:MAG TPA: response regulator [Planctomycetota bacterium]|nr:response regulator [Planctomycetota bacterium]